MRPTTIAITHYLIVLLALSLPFWLNWRLVLVTMLLYHLIFTRGIGYCPLTVWQFGTAEEGFFEKHIKLVFKVLGIRLTGLALKTFIRYGIPTLLVVFSILWQSL